MHELAWLERLGQFAVIALQCVRRLEQLDLDGATRAYADLESVAERFESQPISQRPRCHAVLTAELRDTRLQLAGRIRTLRSRTGG